ncbi:AEC family transporter [Vagococcus sp. AM17-17]|nr:AEC family transporter [Vagococcus sp. AM17-17]
MTSMLTSYSTILVLFIIIALGYILAKRGIFTNDVSSALSFFVINFALPLEIFLRIMRDFNKQKLENLFKESFFPILVICFVLLIGYFSSSLFKVSKEQKGAFTLCFASPSAAFIGMPIILGLYGDKGLPYALLVYVVTSLSTWTIGITLLNRDSELSTHTHTPFDLSRTIKELLSPPIVAFIIASLLVVLNIPLPFFVKSLFGYIGNTTSALAMLFIGTTIFRTGIKNLTFSKEVLGILFGRFFITPLIVLLFAHLFHISNTMGAICLLQFSIPVSNTVAILAGEKHVDVGFTDSSLTYSLLAYLFLFPILMKLVTVFF